MQSENVLELPVRHWEKVGKASKQSIKQDFDSMTTTAQRAAVVKIEPGGLGF